MKYTKKVSVGAFLKKGEDFKDGDIVEIANEGKQQEGQFGMQDLFLLKTKTNEGNVSFNQTTINNLIDGYGEDSINWIGKKVKVHAILSNVQGKMIKVYYFLHPDSKLDETTGQFALPNKEKFPEPPEEKLPFEGDQDISQYI
uniref:Uncharacterized protein n=1 Tax=viral metagenome TaxID=1070528 RepID=A0A6M3L977_9ZZZZ